MMVECIGCGSFIMGQDYRGDHNTLHHTTNISSLSQTQRSDLITFSYRKPSD
jgi:hypothetical protein